MKSKPRKGSTEAYYQRLKDEEYLKKAAKKGSTEAYYQKIKEEDDLKREAKKAAARKYAKKRYLELKCSEDYKEQKKAYARDYYEKNKEAIQHRRKEYEQKTQEKRKISKQKWYEANKEHHQQLCAKYNRENPDVVKKKTDKYRKSNPEKFNAIQQKRRALKINRLHPQHDSLIEESLYILAKNCEAVFGFTFDIDHILPLSKGGWHHHLNLQVIPASVNRKKNNNPDYQNNWPNFKTWRDLPEFLVLEKK